MAPGTAILLLSENLGIARSSSRLYVYSMLCSTMFHRPAIHVLCESYGPGPFGNSALAFGFEPRALRRFQMYLALVCFAAMNEEVQTTFT